MQLIGQKGFGVTEALIGTGMILASLVAVSSTYIYFRRAILDVEARTEFNLLNFQLANLIGDSLLCDKTSLVKAGSPSRVWVQEEILPIPPEPLPVPVLVSSPDSIDFFPDPSDSTRSIPIAKIGEGRFFNLISMSIDQLVPPVAPYLLNPPALALSERRSATLLLKLTARYSTDPTGNRLLDYQHRFNVDVDPGAGAGVPLKYPATNCYSIQSRQRLCEQLGMVYDPVGAMSYNHVPPGSFTTKTICRNSGATLPLNGP